MYHKIMSIGLTLCLTLLQVSPSFADKAVILSDHELDQIYAGGLNFNFDNGFLGSTSTAAENISKGGLTQTTTVNSNAFVVNPNNPNVTIKAPTVPTAPEVPKVPSAISAAVNQSVLDQEILASTTIPEQSLLETPLDTSVLPTVMESNAADASAAALAAQPYSPAVPATPSTPSTPSLPSEPTSPSAAFSPVQPSLPSAPKVPTVDVIATTGGKFSVSVDANSGISPAPFTTNNGYNFMSVSDTAQQNLSAVVNVNAAGSVVPVQVNLTVLMNSTVENISNFNDLKLSNYTTYQVQ